MCSVKIVRSLSLFTLSFVFTACGEDDRAQRTLSTPGEANMGVDSRVKPQPTWSPELLPLRRLTRAQYLNAVREAFTVELRLTRPLPEDLIISRSSALGASTATLSPREVELYEAAAFELASGAVASSGEESWFDCPLEAAAASCLRDALNTLGERLWRRPLKVEERARLWRIFGEAIAALDDWHEALEYPIVSLLTSPYFLFRVENIEGERMSDLALAGRLSFFLWDAPPDARLLKAARAGELRSLAGWRQAAQRLIEAPEATQGLTRFFSDLFSLERLSQLHKKKDPERFVHLSAELGASARAEALQSVVEELWVKEGPIGALFTSRDRYIDRRLAALYELPAPSREGAAWARLDHSERVGFFGSVAFLALQAHPTSSSATLRGLFIQERLLCTPPPPPPSGVDTSIPEPDPTRPTLRDRLEVHLSEPACSGCHRSMDLVGLAFENFDAIGRYRESERGALIDPSGELAGRPFQGPAELATLVGDDPRLGPCLSERLLQHALGRPLSEAEEAGIPWLSERFEESDRRWSSLLWAVIESEAFHGPYATSPIDLDDPRSGEEAE